MKMIGTIVTVIQILCVGLLAFGVVLSAIQLAQRKVGRNMRRFSFAVANDFETDFVRVARSARKRR